MVGGLYVNNAFYLKVGGHGRKWQGWNFHRLQIKNWKTLEPLLLLLCLSLLTYNYQQSVYILRRVPTSPHCLVQATTSSPNHHTPSKQSPSSPLALAPLFSTD